MKNPNDNRSSSQKDTGVQKYIRSNVSVLVVVVPTLFRSCVTQFRLNQRVSVICQQFNWHLNYSNESKWRWRIWQMPALLKVFIAVKLIGWMKLTRLIRVVICNAWCKMKISTGLRNYYRFTSSSNSLKLLFFLSLHRAFWYSHSSFTNRCACIETLIKIYIKVMWLLHVSVYDHHQGAYNWAWLKLYWY